MYCPKCGTLNDDSMSYCQRCGTPLAGGGAAPGGLAYSLKTMGRGPLYLTAVIAYTCSILFSIVGAVNARSTLGSLLSSLVNSFGYSYGMDYSAMQALDLLQSLGGGMSIGTAVIGELPAIVIATGLWLFFVSAMDRSGSPLSSTGLTVIKVMVIIQTVFFSLGALAVALILIMLTAAVSSSPYTSDSYTTGILVAIILVVLLCVAVALFYYIKLIQTIGGIGRVVRGGAAEDCVSMFVVVCCFILGGLSGVSALGSLFNPLGALGSIGMATALICFGILLLNFRSLMRSPSAAAAQPYAQPAPPVPPPYAQPMQQPVQPVQPVQPAPQQAPPAPQLVLPNLPSAPVMPVAPMMDTVVMQETSLLDETGPFLPPARLVHLRTNTVTVIDHQPFRLGKEAGVVDLCISDNTAVSRHHADITYHDGNFYVIDLNSTNHVFLNDRQIAPNTETPLSSGVVLRLADELFRFELV